MENYFGRIWIYIKLKLLSPIVVYPCYLGIRLHGEQNLDKLINKFFVNLIKVSQFSY